LAEEEDATIVLLRLLASRCRDLRSKEKRGDEDGEEDGESDGEGDAGADGEGWRRTE